MMLNIKGMVVKANKMPFLWPVFQPGKLTMRMMKTWKMKRIIRPSMEKGLVNLFRGEKITKIRRENLKCMNWHPLW